MKEEDIADWQLERIALGEPRPAEDPMLADRLAQLQRSNVDILQAHPPAAVEKEVLRRWRARTPRRRAWPAVLVGSAGLAALVMIVATTVQWDTGSEVRAKGLRPELHVHLATPSGAVLLADGAVVRAKDRLQLSYLGAGHAFGVVLSIDGDGGVTLHWPQDVHDPTAIFPNEHSLPFAYVLDAAADFERFFLVTSDQPLDAQALLGEARRLVGSADRGEHGALRVPAGAEQTAILLHKVAP